VAIQTPAFVISAASHPAALFRQALAAHVTPYSGVFGGTTGEMAATQQATPNMSVLVAAGRCSIKGTQLAPPSGFAFTAQGHYVAYNDASVTLTIAAADPTNPRIDVVYVSVQDAFYAGSNNQVVFGVATGVPSGTPAVPSIPANSTALAQVAVAANATSITNSNITDKRTLATVAGGILPTSGPTQYPPSPTTGQYVDDATLGTLLRYNATATKWQRVEQSAVLAEVWYGQTITFNAISNSTNTATDIDATNLKITFTAPDSGNVWVDLEGMGVAQSVPPGTGVFGLYWTLRDSVSGLLTAATLAMQASDAVPTRLRYSAKVTGLTPGQPYTYVWQHFRGSTGGTCYFQIGGGIGALMRVRRAN
jgi:hypothetical protein